MTGATPREPDPTPTPGSSHRRRTRSLGATVSVLAVAAMFASAISVASRVPAEVVVGSDPGSSRGNGMDLDPLLRGQLAPLDPGFIAATLGDEFSALLGLGPPRPSSGSAGRADGSRPTDGPARAPAPAPSGPGTTTTTLVAPVAAPLPQFSELTIDMAADRATASPGDHIAYRITVTNVGGAEFRGAFRIESHHPFWTTDSTVGCDGAGVGPDPDDPCVQPSAPTPGTGETAHTVQFHFGGTIPAGGKVVRQFRVRVDPGTKEGVEIRNHAHLDVVGGGDPTTSNTVTVTVR